MVQGTTRASRHLSMCAAMFLLMTGWATAETPPTSGNLAQNPSFELDRDQDGLPDAWEPFQLCTPYATTECRYERSISYHGESSAMIAQGDLYLAITGTAGWIQRGVVDRGGGKTLNASVYVRAGEPAPGARNPFVKEIFPTRVRIYLFGHDPDRGDDFEGAASVVYEIGPEWKKISHANTFRRDITTVNLVLAREAHVGGGDIWFDKVVVLEVEP